MKTLLELLPWANLLTVPKNETNRGPERLNTSIIIYLVVSICFIFSFISLFSFSCFSSSCASLFRPSFSLSVAIPANVLLGKYSIFIRKMPSPRTRASFSHILDMMVGRDERFSDTILYLSKRPRPELLECRT